MALPNQDALLKRLAPSNTGISGYGMPGGIQAPPIQAPAAVGGTPDEHRALGTAAGQDMSWMDKPGAVATTPAAPKTYQALPGWDTNRLNDPTDKSGKYVMQRWMQDNEGDYNADKVRKFVASQGGNWEINPTSSQDDPQIRQKQEYLSSFDPGRETRWQDVIRDSGPGGENGMSFSNAETRPGEGGSPGAMGPSVGIPHVGGDALSGDPLQKILAAIQQQSGGTSNAQALLSQLGR
jgi:hypothetical protein